MNISRESFDTDVLEQNLSELAANAYPGRGIVIGESAVGNLVQVYWLMGRDKGSRNRVLKRKGNIVHTAVSDKHLPVGDPELTIYRAMNATEGTHIVSNGRQTDAITHKMWLHPSKDRFPLFVSTLLAYNNEPDTPNFTARISAYTFNTGVREPQAAFSIISHDTLTDSSVHQFRKVDLSKRAAGLCVHTYEGDGNPLPAFDQDPYPVPVGESAQETAKLYWESLNPDNRVSVVAKEINRQTGEIDYHIINRHELDS